MERKERGYVIKSITSTKELSPREKVKYKDTAWMTPIAKIMKEGGSFIFRPDFCVMLEIHNEHTEDPDYTQYVIVDSDGNAYTTCSDSLMDSLMDIMSDMDSSDEEYEVEIRGYDSKNYNGKFYKATIV